MSEYRLVMKGVVKTFPGVKALDHAQLELSSTDNIPEVPAQSVLPAVYSPEYRKCLHPIPESVP